MSDEQRANAIVVGVTPGQPDTVLVEAASFAQAFACRLVLAHVDASRFVVVENVDGTVTSLPFDADLHDFDPEPADPALEATAHRLLDDTDVVWELTQLAGDPARALGRLADSVSARAIIVGTRERGLRKGILEFFNGSVAATLAHRQARPVIVVPLAPSATDEPLWDAPAGDLR
ncbi:Nucleotide-binding universal stress protein, UspA family [Plantibacter flavus]|uniref:Nucleotide-binding universal stress UspA family protein n=1 Tax=Plantibacter flavus TaxID=150123 RepID=A0A3N2BZP7_9MICO|nr:universal stress protein [Plantibacter flavus]ROR80713.1 nucleotide-binding universal stress UspA family protein [Plantibacter flavus]SMG31738.1 Nucleotide-binding universal stress protein, UspA family [Plantibacter flavus]